MDELERIGASEKSMSRFELKGTLFSENRDFIVEEILGDLKVLTAERNEKEQEDPAPRMKNFLAFTMVKEGISTFEAMHILSRATHTSIKRFGYLGSKDRRALTAQRISVFRGDLQAFRSIDRENISLKEFEYTDQGCRIGKLYGNRFMARARGFEGKDAELERFRSEAARGIPNFYGSQRFGGSALNIEASRCLFKRDFRRMVFTIALRERDEDPGSRSAREKLRKMFSDYILEDKDIDRAGAEEHLESLPGRFYTEKQILKRLLDVKHDYIGAVRLIPKYLRLLILQSLQYYVFNRTLSRVLLDGIDIEKIPAVGYDMAPERLDQRVWGIISALMREEALSLDQLKIDEIQEASLKTFERDAKIYPEDLNFRREGGDLIVSFRLKKGEYATVVLSSMISGSSL